MVIRIMLDFWVRLLPSEYFFDVKLPLHDSRRQSVACKGRSMGVVDFNIGRYRLSVYVWAAYGLID